LTFRTNRLSYIYTYLYKKSKLAGEGEIRQDAKGKKEKQRQ